MKLLSGFRLSNGYDLRLTRAIGWSSFDVEISGPDIVVRSRFGRLALTIMFQRFRDTGLLQVKNVELKVPTVLERTQVLEQVEAIMREEIS